LNKYGNEGPEFACLRLFRTAIAPSGQTTENTQKPSETVSARAIEALPVLAR
jgi:hypothetical protein